jgi:hypothetical protein
MKLLKFLALFTLTLLTFQYKIAIHRDYGQNGAMIQICSYFTDVGEKVSLGKFANRFYDLCTADVKEHTNEQETILNRKGKIEEQIKGERENLVNLIGDCIAHKVDDIDVKFLYLHAPDDNGFYDFWELHKIEHELNSYTSANNLNYKIDLRCISQANLDNPVKVYDEDNEKKKYQAGVEKSLKSAEENYDNIIKSRNEVKASIATKQSVETDDKESHTDSLEKLTQKNNELFASMLAAMSETSKFRKHKKGLDDFFQKPPNSANLNNIEKSAALKIRDYLIDSRKTISEKRDIPDYLNRVTNIKKLRRKKI